MGKETKADKQDKLVKDALVDELAEAEEKLKEEKSTRSFIEDELHGAQNRVDELEQETRKGQTTTQKLQLELQQEKKSRQDLERKITLLENAAVRHNDEARKHKNFVILLYRVGFVIVALLLFGLAIAVVTPVTRWLGDLTGYTGHRSMTMAVLLMLTVWTLVVDRSGQKIGNISTWGPFDVFHRVKIWLFRFFATIAAGLLAMLIWEWW